MNFINSWLAEPWKEVEETTNAELSSTLDQGDSAIIERYAREQGYVRPNERVFVDISGK